MSFLEIFLIGIGLSMDAFAVSVCKGMTDREGYRISKSLIAGLWFGGFQGLMPFIGWLLGSQFEQLIKNIDHWIAFGLLAIIGANMIRESFGKDEKENASYAFKVMLPLAVATSIDALAVGVTFAFLDVMILPAVLIIGVTTFAFSAAGVKIGSKFGSGLRSKAELVGGITLIAIGIKILIEHLFFGG